ncbi:cAMP-independent regulatory protein pac2 [Hypsizygus marmoreus]|uniref:cAMP-independent regulatory protein pac2 n=1 Tax=Hypsizygus marmoreus TaxID=39966 RepID=A0A369K7E6_HYPMA|nr:cAMP-independent regulatory protein pac2 [Hypsizygus marmoreus]
MAAHDFRTPYSSSCATVHSLSMQSPTLQNIRIRSTRDALLVFNGVANKRLPLITRRLDAEERRAIVSGNVYVWEERGANTEPTGLGMERWTDGMGWGPSRVRDEFLFYHQKESNLSDEFVNPITPWAQMIRKREQSVSRMPSESERLIKQTYSVHVTLPADASRGIVIAAYFSQQRLDSLNTIDKICGIGDVPVPDGWFRSARTGKMRRDHRNPQTKPQEQRDLAVRPQVEKVQIPSPGPRGRDSPPPHRQVPHSPLFFDRSRESSPTSETPSPQSLPTYAQGKLVPLEYLQSVSGARRNPVDEQFLRLFSSQAIGHARPPVGSP